MWKTILLCAFLGLAAAEKATFYNYKVFRLVPITEEHLEVLRHLEESVDVFSFWRSPSYVNAPADLMVAPHKLPEFYEMMKNFDIPYNVHIENVQELIDRTTSTQSRTLSFDFTSYHTLDEIYENLDDLAKQYPNKVQTIIGGKTYEGRQIKGVKVSFKPNNTAVFIEGGIHAREWISPATVMYILHQLLTSKDVDVRNIAESYDWYIFPSFNPDGYVYTHTTNRIWRKTRKPYGLFCYGADPNRNWDYKWMKGGASDLPCMETYAGNKPFSEVETKSMSEFIKPIAEAKKIAVYLSFHSFSQLLMFPYGHTKDHLENYKEQYNVAMKATEALTKRYGTKYRVGNIAETIYVATGSTIDYMKGIHKVRYSYTYELRDQGKHGFLLPPEQIIPTGEETMDSVVAMMKEVIACRFVNEV
ncbi:zinc carboxypeptidase isoform X2 [Harpegnathos saltator]|uniref:Zinc carboxypeptidase A 1 n=2 Tax=Harpegnathos saltator TaxID=610380 RepID=E2BM37_HARSA|nr:zinc carboxypeptidase isoform X2 [Harpegnathos saltator]EFN83243.1 Zinc carboxypeptidase A 1 [Harpegnathos saltator]